MICKMCGQQLTSSTCSRCGNPVILVKRSEKLERLLLANCDVPTSKQLEEVPLNDDSYQNWKNSYEDGYKFGYETGVKQTKKLCCSIQVTAVLCIGAFISGIVLTLLFVQLFSIDERNLQPQRNEITEGTFPNVEPPATLSPPLPTAEMPSPYTTSPSCPSIVPEDNLSLQAHPTFASEQLTDAFNTVTPTLQMPGAFHSSPAFSPSLTTDFSTNAPDWFP